MDKIEKKIDLIKNKNGKVLFKQITLKGKGNYRISLKELDKVYKELLKSGITSDSIGIRAELIDGLKTLKSFDYAEDTLKYSFENYLSSLPREAHDKFTSMKSVYLMIKS
jgi:hypothetical protein